MEGGRVQNAGGDQSELDGEDRIRGHLGRVRGEHHQPVGTTTAKPALAHVRRWLANAVREGARETEQPQVEEERRADHDHEAQDVKDLDDRIEPRPLSHRQRQG